MAALPRITTEHLLDTYLGFPEELRATSASFLIGLSVVKYFLGEPWIEKHLDPASLIPDFMRLQKDVSDANVIQSFKTIDLAELLFNLQHIEGFDTCIEKMKTEKSVESGFAELDLGRMLFINGHKFRFVKPEGKRGDNYDAEIKFKGWTICADAKCKFEGNELSKNIILNELKNSRDQLPSNKPGIFFIKIPPAWTTKYLYEQLLVEAAKEFMRPTGRIVSVKYYIAPYEVRGEHLAQRHAFKEVPKESI